MTYSYRPQDWGLSVAPSGELSLDGQRLVELAQQFGTPLHVVSASRLRRTAREFLACAQAAYAGKVSVHFALKCNWVPGVVEQVHEAGLGVEVTSSYELQLALRVGFAPSQIVVNGPGKSRAFLEMCLQANVRLVVVDSLEELAQLEQLARLRPEPVSILLRVNPGYTPEGMN
jgi:diaminopimelate decarboxylase